MRNLLKFNTLIYFKSKKLLLATGGILFSFILLLLNFNITSEGSPINQLYFQEVSFSFKVLNFCLLIIYPFVFISYLQVDLENNFQNRIEIIPRSKLSQIHSKIILFLLIESTFSIVYIFFMELKSPNSPIDSRSFIIQNLVTYLLFTIPYIYIITSFFYYVKNTTYLYLIHFLFSILSYFDSFYWLPTSWGKLILSFNVYTKQNIILSFYDNHPIRYFYLYFIFSTLLVLFLNRKFQNENK
jgi:hypothetical protein